MKVPGDLVPGQSSLPTLQIAAFLQCPHMVEREGGKGAGARKTIGTNFYQFPRASRAAA